MHIYMHLSICIHAYASVQSSPSPPIPNGPGGLARGRDALFGGAGAAGQRSVRPDANSIDRSRARPRCGGANRCQPRRMRN